MLEAPPAATSLLSSLRGFTDGLVGSVHDRLELLATELQEEKHRLIQIAIWISAVVLLASLAIVFVSVALLVAFWETARVPIAMGLAGAYVLGLVAVVIGFRRYLARQPRPFAATLGELQEDRACIREES